MTVGEFLKALSNYAKEYRKEACVSIVRNRHMNKLCENHKVDKDVVEAVIVDFINYIGVCNCVDYAMYTSDLSDSGR